MRVGQSIWLARRKEISNAEVPEYEKPIEYKTAFNYLTIMPASSRGGLEVMKHGETLYDTWTGIANARYFEGKIKEGDLMYVDGHSPDTLLESQYGYGSTANAVVKSALTVNLSMSLVLTRNQDQVEQ
jgi:hypothetical protein